MVREILLTQGKVALVDDFDYEWLSQWKWFLHHGYAARALPSVVARAAGRSQMKLPMQCAILCPPPPLTVDHVNLDRRDNRRKNLRLADHTQQKANYGLRSDNTSGYKGVVWVAQRSKWRAQIYHRHKYLDLGFFATAKEAALGYNEAAQRLFGEFCRLNQIPMPTERGEHRA